VRNLQQAKVFVLGYQRSARNPSVFGLHNRGVAYRLEQMMDKDKAKLLWGVVDGMIITGYTEQMAVAQVEKMFKVTLGNREESK
jgi:hypothetical protein